MNVLEEIKKQDWFERLGRRGPNFARMIEHVEMCTDVSPLIVETGTAWDKDNYEGQGQSTLIWDWYKGTYPELRVISIDIRQEGIDVAKAQAKNGIEFICGDSIKTLANFTNPENISLLYLDAYDWTPELNLESAAHHFFELAGVWARLRPGTMICVDDRHGNFKGKHWMVEQYMTVLGIEPVFKNCQIGWIKPAK